MASGTNPKKTLSVNTVCCCSQKCVLKPNPAMKNDAAFSGYEAKWKNCPVLLYSQFYIFIVNHRHCVFNAQLRSQHFISVWECVWYTRHDLHIGKAPLTLNDIQYLVEILRNPLCFINFHPKRQIFLYFNVILGNSPTFFLHNSIEKEIV